MFFPAKKRIAILDIFFSNLALETQENFRVKPQGVNHKSCLWLEASCPSYCLPTSIVSCDKV